VDVIVDDTPGVIVVSGFSPVRREIARLSMERLIQDGRIHRPASRNLVAQTREEVNHKILQLGKDASVETNVRGLNNKVLSMLGALYYRTSYGQNVLRHSVEVAFLAQAMADELGLDGSIARRAGLLHDIGKALDHDMEGNHPRSAPTTSGDSMSPPSFLMPWRATTATCRPTIPIPAGGGSRCDQRVPSRARRETLERYIKRLEQLEEIANGFKGVESTYAIQAGREIRVIVNATEVSDEAAMKIARDIANKIETEMTYPGEIQVTLLREVRCIEYAVEPTCEALPARENADVKLNILCIGDIVGRPGRRVLPTSSASSPGKGPSTASSPTPRTRGGSGLTPQIYDKLVHYGVHLITLGDHAFRKRVILDTLQKGDNIASPANLSEHAAGRGYACTRPPKARPWASSC